VTGVLGFIGSQFARLLVQETEHTAVGFARDSDQRNKRRIQDIMEHERFQMIYGDLAGDISGLTEQVDVVVNFAARTFVDHSIRDPQPFIRNNIVGTYNLLEDARRYMPKMYFQVSTDEVYGSILKGAHKEDAQMSPGNPYSASKAAADMLCLSYYNTYGLPLMISRTENNFGPMQHPQKMMPVFTRKAVNGEPLPLYGDGLHQRMWLHVEDHCRAILFLINHGKSGEIYHVAGEEETTNLDMAKFILDTLGKSHDLIEFIDDSKIRPGHDRRYALDSSKLRSLGWKPKYDMRAAVAQTVEWYRDNEWWFK